MLSMFASIKAASSPPPERDVTMVNRVDAKGNTALHYAAESGDAPTVRKLLQRGARSVQGARGGHGETALHYAAMQGHDNIIGMLLTSAIREGSSVDARDTCNMTPLHHAAAGGHLHITRELLRSGADVNLQDDFGQTALHHAMEQDHREVAKELLTRGTNARIRDSRQMTAMDYCRLFSHTELLAESASTISRTLGAKKVQFAEPRGC